MNHIRLGLLLFGACFTAALQPLLAETDFAAKVRALEEKISAQATSPQPERSPSKERIILQLRMLAAQIARGEYDKAQQAISSVGAGELPPELRQEWLDLATSLTSELGALKAAANAKWRADVDSLVNDARKACLEGKSSADLEPLLVRSAALQMQRLGQDNVLGQRTSRKLAGVVATLDSWSNFLDLRAAQNTKAANDILRSLSSNPSQFPVLTIPEIESHIMPEESGNLRNVVKRLFDGVKTPDDIPAALERFKNLKISSASMESQSLGNERDRFEALQKTWELVKKGEDEEAVRALEKIPYGSNMPEMQAQFDMLREQVGRPLIEKRIKPFSDLQVTPDESLAAFVARVLDQLQEKADYASMLEAMKLSDRFVRTTYRGETLSRDKASIERFLAAQRFESVGDLLPAINDYRYVVGTVGGRYAPVKPATEALARLNAQSPEVFKSYEGVVLEELRSLRQQLQILNRGIPGRPYP